MREAGLAMSVGGVIGFFAALFLMPVAMPASEFGSEVVNLDLQQRQLLVALGSSALFVAGVILYAVAVLIEAMVRTGETLPTPEEAATMERLGIEREAFGFRHNGFIYPKLRSAIEAAERRQKGRAE